MVIVSLAKSAFDDEGDRSGSGGGGGGAEEVASVFSMVEDGEPVQVLESLSPSLASASASSSPSSRGLEFVLDVRRLNVALSRAQCAAVVVMSQDIAAASAGGSLAAVRSLSFACRLLEEGTDGDAEWSSRVL